MKKITFFTLAVAIVLPLLSGCETAVNTTIGVANKIDHARDRSRYKDLLVEYLQSIKILQAKGDPLGDYLWTRANEDKMVDNPITDPKVIKQMYEAAAAKGSVDARLELGLRRFREGASFQGDKRNLRSWDGKQWVGGDQELLAHEPIWKDGASQIEAASKTRCFYWEPYIFPPHQKQCLTPVVPAREMWPKFRDGYAYPKDQEAMEYWRNQKLSCENSPAYQEALRKCKPLING